MSPSNIVDLVTAKLPTLKTELPGPQAVAIIEQDSKYISPSYTRPYPLVVKRGKGAMVEDVDGNVFLDFNAGVAVCATGHAHPHVIAAIKKQVDEFLHVCSADFYFPQLPKLAEKIAALTPGSSDKKFISEIQELKPLKAPSNWRCTRHAAQNSLRSLVLFTDGHWVHCH